ncbi:MAG TPA: alpha/beta fold hydrolase [Terriglobales bacterium]
MELHFEASGNGEPLIVLHGLFGSLDNWRSISARLSAQFTVFALDQRNHGGSAHAEEMDYSLMAQDVVEFLEKRGLSQTNVLGHSMGGKTAMQLALSHPNRVSKLIVADIAPRTYPAWHEKMITGMLQLNLDHFDGRAQLEAALAPAVPDLPTRRFLLKNVVRKPGNGFCWRLGLKQIQSNYSRLTEAVLAGEPFQKHALFIRGANSDYVLESDFPEIRRLFPQAEIRTLPDAGHLLHIQSPQPFLQLVTDFLN